MFASLFTKHSSAIFSCDEPVVVCDSFDLCWSDLWISIRSEKSEELNGIKRKLQRKYLSLHYGTQLNCVKFKHNHNECSWTHRLHKFKLLSLLHLLDLEDILQRSIVENLPVLTHLWIRLHQTQPQHTQLLYMPPNTCGRKLFRNRPVHLMEMRLLLLGGQAEVFLQNRVVPLRLLVKLLLSLLRESGRQTGAIYYSKPMNFWN